MTTKEQQKNLNKHVKIMATVVVAMFGFAFLMVPFYNVFCKITGLNGKTPLNDIILPKDIDASRTVTVELLATLNEETPAIFYPQKTKFSFHPGEYVETAFYVKNLTDKPMTIQAIPSVSPGLCGKHVKKVVCFCFQRQELAANQEMVMPLRFTIDPKVDARYKQMTLSYTLFDVTQT